MPATSMRSPHPQLLQVHDTPMECETILRSVMKKASGPQKPRRHIRFNETVTVRAIIHIDDMPDEEIEAIWFHKQDFQEMKAAFIPTVRMISRGEYMGDNEHHCARGLEYRHKAGAQKRKLNKLNALCAVLDEQERQRTEGFCDDRLIAAAFIHSNRHSRHDAILMGMRDAEEVLREEADTNQCQMDMEYEQEEGTKGTETEKKNKTGSQRLKGLFGRGGQRRRTKAENN